MATVNFKEANTPKPTGIWKERISKSGRKVFYRKWNNRFVNVGLLKNNHIYVTIDNVFVKDHHLHYTNDDKMKQDVDFMLETLVVIAD